MEGEKMKRTLAVPVLPLLAAGAFITLSARSEASDHDDGEQADKSRELNLTDHFAFRSPATPTELSIITYFNPRSLPQRQYFMNVGARYEQHVTVLESRADPATGQDDFVFRFEATAPPNAAGVQPVRLTVLMNVNGTLTEVG